ncbi:MAG TPA: PRC-barrel domain-containing protein [Bauldia sp.]|nr:PRC-barrel domain-containing protein [Bauldia sp.]
MNTYQRNVAAAATVGDVTTRETHELIASDKVEGTNVYRSNGDKIGYIERIMLDKRSGKAAYAVMNFGGFLGIGEDSYPLPWSVLTYNTRLGGYEVNVTDEQLKGAPKYRRDDTWWEKSDADRDSAIYGYWGAPPYWL